MDKLDIPQGTLELMILTILAREPMHGYGISQRLAVAQPRQLPGQSGIAVPVAVPPGAGWQAEGGMAAQREQSKREVLQAHAVRTKAARTAQAALGPDRVRHHERAGGRMTLLHRLASVLRWLFNRNAAEQGLDDELQAFIEHVRRRESARRAVARRGAPPGDSRAGRRRTGQGTGPHRIVTAAWLDEVGRDVRYAFRMFVRNPGFTAVVVLTLALGIGANTAIFSLIDALMLRWLPVRNPQELVQVTLQPPDARDRAVRASPMPSSARWPIRRRSSRAWRASAASVSTSALPVPSGAFLAPSSPAATTRRSA